MRYLTGRAGTREEVEAAHARRMATARKVYGLGFWIGLVDDAFAGWWILQPAHGPDQPDDPGVADLGYRLLPRHWRKGLASEGARELVRKGPLGDVPRIVVTHRPFETPSPVFTVVTDGIESAPSPRRGRRPATSGSA